MFFPLHAAHSKGLVTVKIDNWSFGFLYYFGSMQTLHHQKDHILLPCVGFDIFLQTGFPVNGQSLYVFYHDYFAFFQGSSFDHGHDVIIFPC